MIEYKLRQKPCICSRSDTHTHSTMQQYVILERGADFSADIYTHGYDMEDDHIYENITELKRENPSVKYNVVMLSNKTI